MPDATATPHTNKSPHAFASPHAFESPRTTESLPATESSRTSAASGPTERPRDDARAHEPSDPRPPVWLLDVDGVLNAVAGMPDDTVWPAATWVRTSATAEDSTWPLLAARPVIDFIRGIHVSGRAEIRWHSTWRHFARSEVGPALDLPDFPVAVAPEFDSPLATAGSGRAAVTGKYWWKLPAAERVLRDEGRRLLWTDDDLRWMGSGPDGLGPVVDGATGTLLIAPPDSTGLTPTHLHLIDAFLA